MSRNRIFYSAHSAFAYLGSRRFMEIASATGRKIVHRPYYLNRAIEEWGRSRLRIGPRSVPITFGARDRPLGGAS